MSESEFKSTNGLARIMKAAGYSMADLREAWRVEHAFRQELVIAVILTPIALYLPVSAFEKLLLIGSLVVVLIIELLNSAVEAAIDHTSLERHPLAKRAKDLGSAAVLLAMLLVAASWSVVIAGIVIR
ncbi:MAG: diacylglycerol kinase [Betaproteobacteria bacterium]|nr:diacylglycerol kinase [Betaproteobacteria bacterium]